MKENYLFPNQFKNIGWIVFIPALILGLIYSIYQFDPIFLDVKLFAILTSGIGPWESGISFFEIIKTNIMDELLGLLIIIGLLFIAFSKEKSEDEFILKIRLESLVWATYINYIILILTILFVFRGSFFWILVFNMYTILIFFIIRFNWVLYKSKRSLNHEE